MEIQIKEQALAIAVALLLGLGIGMLYDLLRPLRRRGGKPLSAAADALFALVSAFGIFLFAMQADNGRLGTWELAASLLGFLLYMHGLSGFVLPVIEKIFQIIGKFLAACREYIKKVQNLLKKLFPKIRECFKIKK